MARKVRRGQIIVIVGLILSVLVISIALLSYNTATTYKPLKYSGAKEAVQDIDDDLQRVSTGVLSAGSVKYSKNLTDMQLSSVKTEAYENLTNWQKIMMRTFVSKSAKVNLTSPTDFLNFTWNWEGWPQPGQALSQIKSYLAVDIGSLGLYNWSRQVEVSLKMTNVTYIYWPAPPLGIYNRTYFYNFTLSMSKDGQPCTYLKSSNFNITYSNYHLLDGRAPPNELIEANISTVRIFVNGTYVLGTNVVFIGNQTDYDRLFTYSNFTISVMDDRGIVVGLDHKSYLPALKVNNISMYQIGNKIYTKVWVVDKSGQPVSNAIVYLDTRLPNSSVVKSIATTIADGTATFSITAIGPGTYTSMVTNIIKEGWITTDFGSPRSWTILPKITFQISGMSNDALGTVLTIDGTTYSYSQLPHTFEWSIGSTHMVTASTPVSSVPGKQYAWSSWTNGDGLLAWASGTYTVPNSDANVVVNYKTQWQVIFIISPVGTGTTNPSGTIWVDAGSTISIKATANPGYNFALWTSTGSITFAHKNSANTTATISSSGTITANFKNT